MTDRIPIALSSLAMLSLAAAIPTGCGGGTERVSAAELVQRGDEICATERDRFDRIQAEPPANARAAADQTGELIEATESAQSDLKDIEPPEDEQSTYERYLGARAAAIDQMKRGEEAAQDQDSDAYGAAQEAVARSGAERRELAGRLGFKVCSQDTEAP